MPTAFAAIPNSLIIILSIILGAYINLWILSVGSTLAVGMQLLFILYPIWHLHFRFHFVFDWKEHNIHEFFTLLMPVVIGVSVNEINTLVDRTVASQVAIGGISALTYANSLIMLVQGSIVQPIATVCYPKITNFVSCSNEKEAKTIIQQTLDCMLAVLVPITLGFIVFANLIIQALFGRGKFTWDAVQMTGIALAFYAIGIIFIGLREILSRYYYAHSNTKVPVRNATIGVIINIIFNILFSKILGIAGLALATSFSACITSILLFTGCDKYLNCGAVTIDIKELIKIIFSSGIAILIPLFFVSKITIGNLLELIIVITLSIIIYIAIGLILRLKAFHILKKML